MLRDILNFFKKEPWFGLLFLIIAGLYLYFTIIPSAEKAEKKPSPAMEKFLEAEDRLHTNMERSDSMQKFLSDRPLLKASFQFFSFLAVGAFSFGLIVDFFLLFHPPWRRGLTSSLSPPSAEIWKFSMLFKTLVLIAATSLVLSMSLGFAHQFVLPDLSYNFYLLLHATLIDLLSIFIIYGTVRFAGGSGRDLGLRHPAGSILEEIGIALGGYLAVLPLFAAVLLCLVLIAQFFAYEPPPHALVEVFLEEEERSPALLAYSIFLGSVAGPILEEIFFRGFCYPIFKKRWGIGWALVLSSAFFALIHHNTFAFWPIFILGMALAYLYEKRRSLVAPMVLHVTHNSLFISYFFLAKEVVMHEGGM